MEFSSELLVDTAINAAGFIFAGVLSALIYMAMTKKQREVQIVNVQSEGVAISTSKDFNTGSGSRLEFVRFDRDENKQQKSMSTENNVMPANNRLRRNRLEVIKQARQMMDSGKAADEIRKILPLSGAELEFMKRTSVSKATEGTTR